MSKAVILLRFFGTNLVFLFLSLLSYLSFRCGVLSYCYYHKMSKPFIRKHRKGAKNYWLYTELHQHRGLGCFYALNYLFIVALSAFAVVSIFSWIPWMQIPVALVGIVLCLIQIPSIFVTIIYSNRESFGQAFVFFKVSRGFMGPRFHTIFDCLYCILPLGLYLLLAKTLLH